MNSGDGKYIKLNQLIIPRNLLLNKLKKIFKFNSRNSRN